MNDTTQIYRVRSRYAWFYRGMGVFSLMTSFFSLYFVQVVFDIIHQFGSLPVPNIPLMAAHSLLVLQSLALVFVAVSFFVRAELRLFVSPQGLSVRQGHRILIWRSNHIEV